MMSGDLIKCRILERGLFKPTSTIALDYGCHKRAQIWSIYHFQMILVTPTYRPGDYGAICLFEGLKIEAKICNIIEPAFLTVWQARISHSDGWGL